MDGWGCQDVLMLTENGKKGPRGPKPDSHHHLCRDVSPPDQSYLPLCKSQKTPSPHTSSCPLPSRSKPSGAQLLPLKPLQLLYRCSHTQTLLLGPWSPDPHLACLPLSSRT